MGAKWKQHRDCRLFMQLMAMTINMSDIQQKHSLLPQAYGPIFSRGLNSLPKNFSTVPEKTAMLTCKITLPDTPYPVIISKKKSRILGTLSHEFRFFRLINTKNILHFWLLASARKFTFCPKNNGFAGVWGLQPPSSYAYDYYGSYHYYYYFAFCLSDVSRIKLHSHWHKSEYKLFVWVKFIGVEH